MHIPDGFLNLPTAMFTNLISFGFLAVGIRKVNRALSPKRVPLLGICAAFVFTIQLISFPVFGGTSVHLTGGVLIAILLGPFSGLVIMATALILQAILFQHGGIITLGANILNIGIISTVLGYLIYRAFSKNIFIGAGIASWVSVVLASIFCAFELGISGKVPLRIAILGMGSAYAAVGLIETLVVIFILMTIKRLRPDLLELSKI